MLKNEVKLFSFNASVYENFKVQDCMLVFKVNMNYYIDENVLINFNAFLSTDVS